MYLNRRKVYVIYRIFSQLFY